MKKQLLLLFCAAASGLMLKAQNPYPIVPIDTVQFVGGGKLNATPAKDTPDYISPVALYPYKDTVRIEGIVAFNPKAYALSTGAVRISTWLQRKGGGPWSGVQVMLDPTATAGAPTKATMLTETKFEDNTQVGYKVRTTVRYGQFNGAGQSTGETQMYLVRNSTYSDNSVEQLSLTKDTLVYSSITVDQLMTGTPATGQVQHVNTGEQWEGVLVKIPNVTVYSETYSASTKRWTWSVIDDNGNVLDIRDISAYYNNSDNEDSVPKIPYVFTPPAIGTKLSYIRGIITEAFAGGANKYYIAPLYPDDLGASTYASPIVNSLAKTPALITPTDSVFISAKTTKASAFINAVKLYYATGYSATTFDSVMMTKNSLPNDTTIWFGKIPTHAAGTIVKYWVKAIDINGFSADYPNNQGVNSAFIVLNSNVNVNIQDLQYSVYANYATMFNGDSLTGINLRGVITGNAFSSSSQNLLTMQNGTGPNSAILIQRGTGDPTTNWKVGDSVQITSGKVTETFTTTILYNVRGNVIQSGVALPPFQKGLAIDSFATNKVAYSRPWEAVLVRFDSVYVVNVNPDAPSNNGEWSFHKNAAATTGLRVDDMNSELRNLNGKIKKGMMLSYIQGPMWFSFSNFKMIPRGLSDLDLSHLDSVPPVVTILGNNPDTIPVGTAVYNDPGATAFDNIDGNITSSIVTTGTVNGMVIGTYVIWYKATDNWGLSDSAARVVVVKDTTTSHTGLNENELDFAQISLYPVPAQNNITVSASSIKSLPLTVSIIDILGKEMSTRTFTQSKFTETIDISKLNNGVYFCVLKNNGGSRTVRFVVTGK